MNMKIIVSPAKKMNDHEDGFMWKELPTLLSKTKILLEILKQMNVNELERLMKCNHSIAKLNYERYQSMNVEDHLIPALFAYEGLAYQHMSPSIFTQEECEYVQNHLYILSGFYGLLKAFDGIKCYRLEMQTKVKVGNNNDLYDFWRDSIAEVLFDHHEVILNLASKEYSKVIEPYLTEARIMITCVFAYVEKDKLKVKGTEAKMCRGYMVRYMATNKIEDLNEIKKFEYLGYTYNEEYSTETKWYFVKK